MLHDEKILITGLTGQIGFPMAEYLAANNEVWGLARYSEAGSRERVQDAGVTAVIGDLASADYADHLPTDFSYLVHMAAYQGSGQNYDLAISINAEGTGLLMQHCQNVKAALVASTFSVYYPNPDPSYRYVESDPLGDCHALHSPPYSVSKIAQEAVARTMARALNIPTTIARINASYGPNGGLPAYQLDWIINGEPVRLRAPAPSPYNPIHQDDMNAQVEPLLAAASTEATIVNWCGDETVSAEEWCTYLGTLAGREPEFVYNEYPGAPPGGAGDPTKRQSVTGPCSVDWQTGMRTMWEQRYPDGRLSTDVHGQADGLGQAYDD